MPLNSIQLYLAYYFGALSWPLPLPVLEERHMIFELQRAAMMLVCVFGGSLNLQSEKQNYTHVLC